MAVRATADQVAADMRPPDYRFAVQQVRGGIDKKREKISSVNGEIADIYAKIEGKGVNRKAVKIFAALDKLEADDRNDIIRSIDGLIAAAGWDDPTDLVDAAEDNVVRPRFGGQSDSEDSEDNEDDGELDGDIDESGAEQSGIDAVVDDLNGGRPVDGVTDAMIDKARAKANARTAAAAAAKKAELDAKASPPADDSDLAG